MPGDNDPETNIGVIVSRLNRLQADVDDLGMTVSATREQMNVLSRDKLNRAEFIEWIHNAQEWREEVIAHLERIDGRLGMWAGGSVVVTVIAAIVAGMYGRGP